MSYSIDANILLYASDAASPRHEMARAFLEECARGPETLYLAWPTVLAYLRIATHSRVFSNPLSPRVAEQNIDALLALPHVRTIAEEEGFWAAYREVTAGKAVRGKLVPDAHLATLLREHGVKTLYTSDVDFRRFDFLDVKDPLR